MKMKIKYKTKIIQQKIDDYLWSWKPKTPSIEFGPVSVKKIQNALKIKGLTSKKIVELIGNKGGDKAEPTKNINYFSTYQVFHAH